jgi:hypothetical protein
MFKSEEEEAGGFRAFKKTKQYAAMQAALLAHHQGFHESIDFRYFKDMDNIRDEVLARLKLMTGATPKSEGFGAYINKYCNLLEEQFDGFKSLEVHVNADGELATGPRSEASEPDPPLADPQQRGIKRVDTL